MNISAYEANSGLPLPGHLLQALQEHRALAQMRIGVPVVYYVIEKLCVPKPADAEEFLMRCCCATACRLAAGAICSRWAWTGETT